MPYKRSYRKRTKKRTSTWRRRRPRFKKQYQSKYMTGAPASQYVKLRYSERYTFDTGVLQAQIMSGNSVYDPDYTSVTNHQPLGLDQYAALYNKYRVLGSSCKVKLISSSSAAGGMLSASLTASNHIDTDSSIHDAAERSNTKTRLFGSASGNSLAFLSKYKSTRAMLGDTAKSDRSQSAITTNPADQWYWILQVGSVDEATTISGMALITVTYYVKFFDKAEPSPS